MTVKRRRKATSPKDAAGMRSVAPTDADRRLARELLAAGRTIDMEKAKRLSAEVDRLFLRARTTCSPDDLVRAADKMREAMIALGFELPPLDEDEDGEAPLPPKLARVELLALLSGGRR